MFVSLQKRIFMISTSNRKERIIAYDAMKCFAIFLVIWGHCIGEFSSAEVANLPVYRVIYSFHMPLFMMISGYFACSSFELSFKDFICKKFRQLLYPCLIFGGIIWLCVECYHSFHYQRENISILGLLIDYYWFSDFWFLKSCFVCYCLAYIGIKSGIRYTYWITITLIISQLIAPFFVSFMYPCFLMGIILRKNEIIKARILQYQWNILSIFIIMLLFYTTDTWNKSHGIPNNLINAGIGTWIEIIMYRLFRLIIGLFGALSIFTIFIQLFDKRIKKSSFQLIISEWGKYTLEVYIFQSIFLERILTRLFQFDNVNPFIYNFILTPTISILLLFLFVSLTKGLYKIPKVGTFLFSKTI